MRRARPRISGWETSSRCGRRRSPSWRAWESPSRAARRNGATSLRDVSGSQELHRQLPIAGDGDPSGPVHDSKEALRFRAVCDERITLPLSSLRAFDSVYTKLVAGLSKSSMVEIKANWRSMSGWSRSRRRALYDRLGYSQDLIRQLGCSPALGASGSGGGAAKRIGPQGQDSGGSGHHAPHAGPGHQAVPPDHHVHGHNGRGPEVHQQALPEGNEARVLGLCGVRPGPAQHQRMGSGGQGEVQDHRGLHVQVLQRLLEGEPRGDQAAPDHGVAQGQGHMPAAGDGRAPGAAI